MISATVANTAALAASNTSRRGVAASVARIAPEPYSLVTASTPKTLTTSKPTSVAGAASKVRYSPPWPVPELMPPPIPAPIPMAAARPAVSIH
jgi:hypothetical protein